MVPLEHVVIASALPPACLSLGLAAAARLASPECLKATALASLRLPHPYGSIFFDEGLWGGAEQPKP